jgi:hypothetical protein
MVLGDDGGGGYVRKCARILLPAAAHRTTTVRINKIRELSHNVIIVVVLRVAKVERTSDSRTTPSHSQHDAWKISRRSAASYFCAEGFFRLPALLICLFVCVRARSLAQAWIKYIISV